MQKLADYKDVVFVPSIEPHESPELREALLELDAELNAIQKRQQPSTSSRNDSCSPAVGAFIDSLSDEQTMKRVVDECSSEVVRMIEGLK